VGVRMSLVSMCAFSFSLNETDKRTLHEKE